MPTNSSPALPGRGDYEVVLVGYHSAPMIAALLERLPADIPVTVVDNARGADGLDEVVARRPGARYVDSGGGKGFAKAANLGARATTLPFLVFVNPDAGPTGEDLDALVAGVAQDPGLASLSPLTVNPDGRVEIGVAGWEPTPSRALVHALGAHKLFPTRGLWARPTPARPIAVDWTSGACLAVRRETFLALGGFDERYFVYNEDVAYGRRAREAGMRQGLRTDMSVTHTGAGSGTSSTKMLQQRGASMVDYLGHHNPRRVVVSVRLALTLGYLPRVLLCRVRGRPGEAREHLAYLRGLWTGAPDMS